MTVNYSITLDEGTPLAVRILNYLRRNNIKISRIGETAGQLEVALPKGWVYEDEEYYYCPSKQTLAMLNEDRAEAIRPTRKKYDTLKELLADID